MDSYGLPMNGGGLRAYFVPACPAEAKNPVALT